MSSESVVWGYNYDFVSDDYFRSKIGGKPSWLNTATLLDINQHLTCSKCSMILTFLLQMYVPKDDDASFHVMLYLFGCSYCGETFRFFRNQLPRENPFHPNSYIEDYTPILEKCCEICGFPEVHKNCQVYVLPEMDIKSDTNSQDSEFTESDHTVDSESSFSLSSSEKSGDESSVSLIDYSDKVTKLYCEVLRKYDNPIIRYLYKGTPLLYKTEDPIKIPPCEYCSNPRVFEFQVTSLFLTLINDKFNFATLLCYTCSNCCTNSKSYPYIEEFVYRQLDDL